MKYLKAAVLLTVFLLAIAGEASPRIRLVYGKDWNEASRRVKVKLEKLSAGAAKGRYEFEYADEESKMADSNLGTLKIPAIFAISEDGNCFAVVENKVGSRNLCDLSEGEILDLIDKADSSRRAAAKKDFKSADECGEFLKAMERFVGGPKRVVSRGFYENVFTKLKSFDPEDKLGWQRRFTIGDGIDIVAKATEFRKNNDFAGGEAYVKGELAKPTKHLTTEQIQAIYMAKFALYREDAAKREEMKKLLGKVLELGEQSLWGTSAIGWLNILGEAPLSAYWGWHKGDFKGKGFKEIVRYGVDCAFADEGEYTIAFKKKGEKGFVEFKNLEMIAEMESGRKAITLAKSETSASKTVFRASIDKNFAGKVIGMVVYGDADDAGISEGDIEIKKTILRPRGKIR